MIGQISAALACGNRVIVKPSEHTSILGFLVVKKFHELGIPKDALELVLGDGSYGDVLTKTNSLQGVAFTGSLPTAKKIQSNLIENQVLICSIQADDGEYFKQIRFDGLEKSQELRISEDFIETGKVSSQNQLKGLLKKNEIVITQATLSRDLSEIGAIKKRLSNGRLAYLLPKNQDNCPKFKIAKKALQDFVVNVLDGVWWRAAIAFLLPILSRAYLTILTESHVNKLQFEGNKVIGVRFWRGNDLFEASVSGEIILASGAIGSPQIMQALSLIHI